MKRFLFAVAIAIFAVAGAAAEVFNFGVPGLTVRGVSGGRLKRILEQKPDLAVLMLGRDEMLNARRLCSMEEFKQDYEAMLAVFRGQNIPVLMINIHPGSRKADDPDCKRVAEANAILAALAKEHDIPLIDLHALVLAAGEQAPAEYLSRRSFSAGDSAFLARRTAALIREKFPSVRRIVCIGGEAVHGYRLQGAGTAEGESFPAQLKMQLNGVTAASRMPAEVIPIPGCFVSRAKWIWYPENYLNKSNVKRVFRKKVTLTQVPVSANFICSGDDWATVCINGQPAASGDWERCARGDAAPRLHQGENLIAIEVHNLAGEGGMIFRMDMRFADGSTAEVISDGTWQSFIPAAGCFDVGFDEVDGEAVWVIGDAGAFPWSRVAGFDYREFLAEDEKIAMAQAERDGQVKFAKILQQLCKEPRREYRVAYRGGRAAVSDGEEDFPAMIFHPSSFVIQDYRALTQLNTMREAGYRLYKQAFTLETIWKEDGSIDFALIDKKILTLLSVAPDARILIGIGMNAPKWYVMRNLPETVGYARKGAPPTFEAKDQARALRMSYASEKWRNDLAEVVTRIISHLEKSPFAPRIFAYAPHCGVYNTEWHYFGMRNELPDNGPAMTAAFRKFLRSRYRNDVAALRAAWKAPDVTFETAQVPGEALRTNRPHGALRVRSDAPPVMDYLLCHQQVVADTILFFDRAAKNACGNRALVGNYCGYMFEMNFPTEGWHLENLRILESPCVDFQLSPYGYGEHRMMGAGGFARAVTTSYPLRGKMLIYEDDTRTHLNTVAGGHFAANAEESAALVMRCFAFTLTSGCGYWILDFGRPWFEDALLRQALRRMHEIRNTAPAGGSVAQTALVCDIDSVIYHTYSDKTPPRLNQSLLDGVLLTLGQCAVPFDTVLVQDVGNAALPDYQVYIFCNMLKFTPERAAMVKRLREAGKTILWLYAPGVIREDEISLDSVTELTGFKVRMLDKRGDATTVIPEGKLPGVQGGHRIVAQRNHELSDVPLFVLDDQDAEILGRAEIDGVEYPTLGLKRHGKGVSLIHTIPRLDRTTLTAMLQQAGIHRYLKESLPGDVIMADRSFLCFHTASGGVRHFTLPTAKKVTMLWPEKRVISAEAVLSFTLESPAKRTILLRLD